MRPQVRLLTLVGSACVGAIALSAGSSQAATWSCSFLVPSGCDQSGNGWTISNFALGTITGYAPGLTLNQGNVFTTSNNKIGITSVFTNIDILNPANNRTGIWGTGSFSFTLTYTGAIGTFTGNSSTQPTNLLNSNPPNVSPTTPFLQAFGATGLATTGFGAGLTTATITGNPNSLNVIYSWNIPGNGSVNRISSFDTSFGPPVSVPGPLPILGGGVAFGFSRRLRRRIQASKALKQA